MDYTSRSNQKNKLILLCLNEINFDYVSHYLNNNNQLSKLKKILNLNFHITKSEKDYKLLEPWIQWPSIYTGHCAKEHNLFRLGDCEKFLKHEQIFEHVEKKGFKVDCISPMNAKNRLKNEKSLFIPDPWTQTKPGNSFIQKIINNSFKQLINDSAKGKIKFSSLVVLIYIYIYYVGLSKKFLIFKMAIETLRDKWKKSLIFDVLLSEIALSKIKKSETDFITLFLNAGAHLQHHYLFNSKANKNTNKFKNSDNYINKNTDPFFYSLKILC